MISTGRKIPVFRNAKLIPTARASILVATPRVNKVLSDKEEKEELSALKDS